MGVGVTHGSIAMDIDRCFGDETVDLTYMLDGILHSHVSHRGSSWTCVSLFKIAY